MLSVTEDGKFEGLVLFYVSVGEDQPATHCDVPVKRSVYVIKVQCEDVTLKLWAYTHQIPTDLKGFPYYAIARPLTTCKLTPQTPISNLFPCLFPLKLSRLRRASRSS